MPKSRKLQYADRVAIQQADQAIRKDVLRALVEVITNSNDSYSRLESAGKPTSGEIIIEIQRKHMNSMIRVRDFAEGMTDARMDKVVGTYGEATSGIKEDQNVRGMWGRGLKDAIFGLGYGYVRSFQAEKYYSSSLLVKKGIPTFDLEDATPSNFFLREKHGIRKGNGTEVEIIVSRNDVKVPQFDNIRNHLQRHFELRPIMSNPKRRILLRELAGTGKCKQEHQLAYKHPTGEMVLNTNFMVDGFSASVNLEIYRSNIPLSTKAEEGDYADGGLLVISKSMVLSLTMLKFENDPYASCFYGSIKCDYLHELLKKDEPVLTATRDGINWSHAFAKALKAKVEEKIEPLVQAERDRAKNDERTKLDKQLREKLNSALKELNSIAFSELGKLGGGTDEGDDDKKRPYIPPSGFGFVPEFIYVQTGQTATLTLRAELPEKAEAGSIVTIESDSPEIVVLTPQVVIEAREDFTAIGQAHIKVEGRQVGSEGVITAYLNDNKAIALVQVRSKKEIIIEPPQPTPKKGGLFRDIKFDDRTDPRQRVYFDRLNSNIIIATAAPSVKIYLDKQNRLDNTEQGQVLLAELISEAMCREVARQGVERGTFLAPDGAETDAIQQQFIRLQNQYAHLVHSCIVKMN